MTGSLRKSSAAGADAKKLDLALTYRKAFSLLHHDELRIINAIDAFTRDPINEDKKKAVDDTLNAVRKKILAGVVIDGAGRLEAEALNFDVTNAI